MGSPAFFCVRLAPFVMLTLPPLSRFPALLLLANLCTWALGATAQEPSLKLNEQEYLEMPGLNVMLAHDYYPESHQGGVGFIQNGLRVATNGDLRLETVPGQWQPVPAVGTRQVNRETGEISVRMTYPDPVKNRRGFNPIDYPDLELSYTVRVIPDGKSFRVRVDLDRPLPAEWVGRVGFNLELFPGFLFGKSYSLDGYSGLFPLHPTGPDSLGLEGVEMEPLASGHLLAVAPESETQRLTIEALGGATLALLDGRARHNNGWFVVRSLIPAGASSAALEWRLTPHAVPAWLSQPVIQHSQVGYHPGEPKIAVLELDRADTRRPPLVLLRTTPTGALQPVLEAQPTEWGRFLRYTYLQFDFTRITESGTYVLRYGDQESSPFVISPAVYSRGVWQPTLEYFLPVQMCHMRVNDRYRVWHGVCHLDDARMAPLNHNHFDGYLQGPSTLTTFKPGDSVPGLNVGGWHDAGDYDLRVESQADTVRGLALAWEYFHPELDSTTVDQASRLVEIHRPDSRPDLLQQVEHGALTLVSSYKALGRLYRGIIVPTLRQYTHLGDASTMTDNQPYATQVPPAAAPQAAQVPDDRWVFTEEEPRHELQAAAALAAASRVLRGFNEQLAADCLKIATELWQGSTTAPAGFRLVAAVELLQASGGADYRDFLLQNAATLNAAPPFTSGTLARSLSLVDDAAYTATVRGLLRDYASELEKQFRLTPYGVPYEPHIWGAGWGIQHFGVEQFLLHRHCPDLFSAAPLHRSLQFILGAHPGPGSASFVSGVGAHSVTAAYGPNRGDFSHVPGGSVSGTALIRPDYPELLDWPFLWQQTEYCLGTPTTDYLFLVLAAEQVLKETP